jgi:hypothetical protein
MNNFQGRYAIRHPWVGPIDCKEPRRGVWGGPWYDLHVAHSGPTAAQKLASVPRGGVTLTSFVRTDVPEIGVKAGKGPLPSSAVPKTDDTSSPAPASSSGSETRGGCAGCVVGRSSTLDLGWLALLAIVIRRMRRSK